MLIQITPPSMDPINLQEAKAHLRQTSQAEDVYISGLIQSATGRVELFTSRALLTQTWDLWFDCQDLYQYSYNYEGQYRFGNSPWDYSTKPIIVPKGQLQSVSYIYTYDINDTQAVFDAANYYVDTSSTPGRIWMKLNKKLPSNLRPYNSFVIRFIAGWTDPALIPEQLRTGVRLLVSHMFENREPTSEIPIGISDVLFPWKLMTTSRNYAGW